MFHLPRSAIVLRFAIKSNSHVTLPRNLPRVLGRTEASDRAARAQRPSKYAIVRVMPSRNPIVGSHPGAARASAISGCRYVGSSDGSGLKNEPRPRIRHFDDRFRQRANSILLRVAEIDRLGYVIGCLHQRHQSADEIVVAE